MGSYLREGADMMTCRECGEKFDLNGVPYYGPRCPRCRSADGDGVTCPFCGDMFDPTEGVRTSHHHATGESESLLVCSAECANDDSKRGGR